MAKKNRLLQKRKRMMLLALLLALGFAATFVTVSYGKEIYNMTVTANVPPHYEVKAEENNLFINTNMDVYINNKKIQY